MSPARKSHGQQKQRQKQKPVPAAGGRNSSPDQAPLDLADKVGPALGTLFLLPEECEALRQCLPQGVSLVLVGSTEEASRRNSRSSSRGRGRNKLTGIEDLPTSASSGGKRKADSVTPDSSERRSRAKKTRQAAQAGKSDQEGGAKRKESGQSATTAEATKTFTEQEKMVLKMKIDKLNDLDRIEGVIAYLNVGQGGESEDIQLDLDSVPPARKQGLFSLVDEELRAARREVEAAEVAGNDSEVTPEKHAEPRTDAQNGLADALAGTKAVMRVAPAPEKTSEATENTEVRTGFNDSMLDNAMDILALVNEFSTWM